MTQTTIRIAKSTDLDAIARLFDAYRQFYQQPPDLRLATQFIRDRLQNRDSAILVAAAETNAATEIVGFCQLYPSFCSIAAAPIYVLYDLYVASASRQTGIGQSLLLAAHDLAKAHKKVRLDLSTAKSNLPAQRLYESLGWVRDDVYFTYSLPIT
ncbi:MAG TPA: N-acetyltransferase [Chroococcidiopsis sp.]